MITRFQVDGFKNLVGVDLYFGPFTCIAGVNGIGKSNLFDAIRFLGELASRPLMEAVATVRDPRYRDGERRRALRSVDVRSIFHRTGGRCGETIRFEVEMIVPRNVVDDLGQNAEASTTFLRYELELGLRKDSETEGFQIEIRHESLLPLKKGEAVALLRFGPSPDWRQSVILGARYGIPFVSTAEKDGKRVIQRHADGGSRGKPIPALASTLKGTIASVAQADAPTLLCARREMQSWLLLQFEPAALREPSSFLETPRMRWNGEGLAATLFRIARSSKRPEGVYASVANRLAELIEDVRDIGIDRNEKLELLTLVLTDREGTPHQARSLSDGTLRFLALSVLEMDSQAHGVLCFEEPENGIHPDRIAAMLRLLQDISLDPDLPLGPDNPLRQVIVNTHSPLVVGECRADSLILAKAVEVRDGEHTFRKVRFQGVDGTWRAKTTGGAVSKGELQTFLSPVSLKQSRGPGILEPQGRRRIRERPDLSELLPGFEEMRVAEE